MAAFRATDPVKLKELLTAQPAIPYLVIVEYLQYLSFIIPICFALIIWPNAQENLDGILLLWLMLRVLICIRIMLVDCCMTIGNVQHDEDSDFGAKTKGPGSFYYLIDLVQVDWNCSINSRKTRSLSRLFNKNSITFGNLATIFGFL